MYLPGGGRQRVSRTSAGEVLNSFSTFCRKRQKLLIGLDSEIQIVEKNNDGW